MMLKHLFKAFSITFQTIGHTGLISAALVLLGGFSAEALLQPIPAVLIFAGACLMAALVDDD